MKLRPQVAALVVALVVGLAVMMGYIVYRQFENDRRCAAILGQPGATWNGGQRCVPPPVIVGGLL